MYRLKSSPPPQGGPTAQPGLAPVPSAAELEARSQADRNRANHTGSQGIGTVDGLIKALARKANAEDLHRPVQLAADSSPGLELDGQTLKYTPPEIPEPSPPRIYAESIDELGDVSEPRFGVVYVSPLGSFMLSELGDQWIQIAGAVSG